MHNPTPELQRLLDATPGLVDRIFDHIVAELPELADKLARIKADMCATLPADGHAVGRRVGTGLGDDDPVARMVRIADGRPSAVDLMALRNGFTAYLNGAGDLSLERCLRMPTTWKAWRRAQRDYWLCQAAQHVDANGTWSGCVSLEREWETFLSRGPWRQWRDDASPPDGTSKLSSALFFASRYNRGCALVARQLDRIVRHVFDSKSQSHTPNL